MSKFRAVKVIDPVDGKFDSKAEYARWVELKLLEKAGRISQLMRQRAFPLEVVDHQGKPQVIGKYVSDFTYFRESDGELEVEDVKGVITPMFRWKSKHFLIQYGFPITIIGNVKKRKPKKNGGAK